MGCSALPICVLETCKTEATQLLQATSYTARLSPWKEFFLTSSLNLLCFNLWTLPHVFSPRISVQSLTPSSQRCPQKNQYVVVWSHWNYLFLRLNKPISLSLSSQDKCSSSLIILVVLHQLHFYLSMSFLYWESQNWAQHSRCGLMSSK